MVSAEPCPDVEVVFARGTRATWYWQRQGCSSTHCVSQVGADHSGLAVNYPASNDFASSELPKTVIDGIRDAGSHIQSWR